MDFFLALFFIFSSLTIYKIAYSRGPLYLRILWIVALVVAIQKLVLQ